MGPAHTFSPISLWDLQLKGGRETVFNSQESWTTALFVLSGEIEIAGEKVGEAQLAVLERKGSRFVLKANKESRVLLLSGEPLNEPIVGYGPFVMNTESEIRQAFLDYQNGKMGRL
jgi:hypothetical protein